MTTEDPILDRPIRVVVLGSGPGLERGVQLLSSRLEAQQKILLTGIVCQSSQQGFAPTFRDLWQRRGWLAIPVLLMHWWRIALRSITRPQEELKLKQIVTALSDRIFFVPDIHADSVLTQICQLAPDLALSYGSPILQPKLFELPAYGTLGIHHGTVPKYRGKKTTFWAMYNGEETAGVTIQRINSGLDKGEIVKEGSTRIANKSFGRVWSSLEQLGIDLFIEAILEVRDGTATYRPQTGPKGKLYRDPKLQDIISFWVRTWQRRLLNKEAVTKD